MKLRTLSVIALAAGLAFGAAHAQTVSDAVKSAVADAGRPAADKERDANRKPAEITAFAGVKAGDVVADINPGGGYFTRIFSKTVGAKGKVYALVSDAAVAKRPEAADGVKAIAADKAYGGNIEVVIADFANMKSAMPLDVAWTSWNYHDFKNRGGSFTANMNKAIFAALKPGGTYIVIDHAAAKDAAGDVTEKLHRVSPDVVKQEVMAAGFKLEAESNLLAHADDNHTSPVFDGAVRGKTDSFLLKFRKP
ncbi:MAG: methyltransferase [Proteobacteria bacterium]|nr:methyltransferase [Pseudomonadota bacterium]